MDIVKIVLGIDISMKDFYVCLKVKEANEAVKIKGTRKFDNTHSGYNELYSWVLKRVKQYDIEVQFVMEATGVYYENLAHYLFLQGDFVSVVLPTKIKNYAKSHNVKTKTDKIDAKTIADFGLERIQEKWEPLSPFYNELRDLCREKLSMKKEVNRAKNQLHSLQHAHNSSISVLKLKEEQIAFYEKSIDILEQEIKDFAQKDIELMRKLEIVQTIPGVSFEVAIAIVCETNGFRLVESIRQLVSYSGLDVEFKESGAFKGKTRITKKGNSKIRQVLYMPAMSAVQYNPKIKKLHERICEKNPTVRKKGIIAGMRKILILIYVLWKKEEVYLPNFQWN